MKRIKTYKQLNELNPSVYGDLDEENFFGDTSLSKAIDRNNLSYIEKLIDAGANINHINKHGDIVWKEVDTLEILKYLVKKGADINYINKPNMSLLMYLSFSFYYSC